LGSILHQLLLELINLVFIFRKMAKYLLVREVNIKKLVLTVVPLVLAGIALFNMRVVSADIALLGLAIMAVSLLPSIIFLYSPNEASRAPFFPTVGLFYALFFGLPVFLIPLAWPDADSILLYWRAPISGINASLMVVVLVAIGGSILAFYLSRRFFIKKVPIFKFPEYCDLKKSPVLLWVLLVSHQLYLYNSNVLNVASIGQFLQPAGYVAIGGLTLLTIRKKLSRLESAVFLLIFLPSEFWILAEDMFLTKIVLLLGFLFFIVLGQFRLKLKFTAPFFVVITLILALYGASTELRNSRDIGIDRISSVIKGFVSLIVRGEDRYNSIAQFQLMFDDRSILPLTFDGRFKSLVHRTGHLWLLHRVGDLTPSKTPYWRGVTYKPMVTSFIPRIVYPNKPRETVGNEFGLKYGLIMPNQILMSVNLPWLVELLANFGKMGVVWGMIIIGILLAFLDRVFNSREMKDLEHIVGLAVIFPLVYPESNFTVMTGTMFPLFLSLYVYFTGGCWVLAKFRGTI
jgi:hypothetical protein